MADEADDIGQQDAGFLSLPVRLRKCIDRAFDNTVARQSLNNVDDGPSRIDRSAQRRKFANKQESNNVAPKLQGGFIIDDPQPGGFIVDEPQPGGFIVDGPQPGGFIVDEPQPGGFIVDGPQAGGFNVDDTPENLDSSKEDVEDGPSRIPLALIPSALQLLDLQPDDEDVLSVFRNAASGWDDPSDNQLMNNADVTLRGFVSRSDWRAVCAALLDTGDAEPSSQSDDSVRKRDEKNGIRDREDSVDNESEDVEFEDAFVASDDGSDSTPLSEGSDDEYVEGGFIPQAKAKRGSGIKGKSTRTRKSTRASRAADSSMDEDDVDSPKRLTTRQKEVCRDTFGLFFPDVPEEHLDRQKIMIKDISRVAKLLKEKITTDEIIEMLEAFSTSADKTMNLGDFERMMIAAKLA